MPENNIGKIVQVIGPVIDVEFPEGSLPAIHNAVTVKDDGKGTGVPIDIVTEVAQHLGENRVRCISMKPTDGMVRGMTAVNTGAPISVPVGVETLGRMFNVVGTPIDDEPAPAGVTRWPIHRLAPPVEEILYPAMEDFQLDLIIGEGPGARSIRIDLPPFTLVGATTREGLLSAPFRGRFGLLERLVVYPDDDIGRALGIFWFASASACL